MPVKILKWFTVNLALKIWSILIALFLWFHVTTEEVVEEPFLIPLETQGLPETLVLLNPPPEYVQVKIKGRGKQILRLKLTRGLVAILDLSRARKGEVDFKISPDMIALPTWTTATVSQIVEPKGVNLDFDREATQSIQVLASTAGYPKQGYILAGNLVVEPTEVSLRGGRSRVKEIERVETEPIDISGLAKTFTTRVRIVPPEGMGFSCQPESVSVTVPIEEVVEMTFTGIPVQLLNSPQSAIEVEPSSVTLVLRGARARMEQLKAQEISVTIDLKEWASGGDSLRPAVRAPEGVSLVSAEPEVFRVKW